MRIRSKSVIITVIRERSQNNVGGRLMRNVIRYNFFAAPS